MSLLRTYTTGIYNTWQAVSDAKKLKLFLGEKWFLKLADGDVLCLLVNEPLENIKNHVVIVIHGLAGAAMDPSVVAVTQKFLTQGYHVVRMNMRGSGHGAGYAKQIYHAGKDDDFEAVVNAVSARYPAMQVSMIAMSLSSNMMFRYLARSEAQILNRAVALSPVIDLKRSSNRISSAYMGMVNKTVMSLLKSYFVKRKRAFADTSVPDWQRIKKLYQFDELFIAPELGFKSARDYYESSTALPFIGEAKVPWRAVISLDDPIAISEKKIFPGKFPKNSVILQSGGHLYLKKHGGLGEVALRTFENIS